MYAHIVLLAILAAPSGAASVSASSAAQTWLRSHKGAPDELAELKGANPEAFAIVQALLTKRSLGLLNSKHPTTSFSDAAPVAQTETVERGPEAFAKLAAPADAEHHHHHAAWQAPAAPEVALPYANVHSSHTQSWLNWKPQSAGADQAMVASVMGMVGMGGAMKGGHAAAAAPQPEAEAPEPPPPAVVESAPAPKAAVSDWGSIGDMWGSKKKPHQQAARQEAPEEAMPQQTFQKPAKQDWNAVEQTKGNNDEKAVNSLLNMVSRLKGRKADKLLKKHHVEQASALSNDLEAWGDAPVEASFSAPVAPVSAPVFTPAAISEPSAPVVAQSAPEHASSWGSMFGSHRKPHHVAAAVRSAHAAASASASKWLNWKPKAAGADDAMVANALSMVGSVNSAPEPVAAPVVAPAAEAVTPEVRPQAPAQDKDEKAVNSLLNMVVQMKGGKSAEKLLRKQHGHAEENALSSDDSLFSAGAAAAAAPVAEVAEVSAPTTDSWGSIGGMLGVRHKAQPAQAAMQQATVEKLPADGLPSEVEALISSNNEPVHHAVQQAPKGTSYKDVISKKQDGDENAVKKLLSMVAQMKGGRKAEALAEKYEDSSTDESSLSNDMSSFRGAAAAEAPEEVQRPRPRAVAPTEDVQEQAAAEELVSETHEAPAAPARKNNFLDSLTSSFSAPKPAPRHVAALPKQNSYLSSFSWSDDEEKAAPTKAPMTPQRKKLLSWLDPPTRQEPVVAAQPQAPVNPYLVDLSN